jgi:hypothetical protein
LPSWTSPGDVRAALRKKWDSGALLSAYARGAEWVPWSRPVRGPAAREIGERLDEVRTWAASWDRAGSGSGSGSLRVEYVVVGGRHFGTNRLPGRAWVDGFQQAWEVLGVRASVQRFAELLEMTRSRCPVLVLWVERRPLKALGLAEVWERMLRTVAWIEANQRPGMYLRQVDVPGVDTKFIEAHRAVLAELLDLVLEPGRIYAEAGSFEERYGFARKPGYVRFRSGSLSFPGPGPGAWFSEMTVRAAEFTAPPSGTRRVFVVENEVTYLAFPVPHDAIVIFGGGFAVSVLAPLAWLRSVEIVYWGDIDTHGFVILGRLRELFPHVESMLMDSETLLAHRSHWVTEPVLARDEAGRLTASEEAVYRELAGVRLEQERISFAALEAALRAHV